MTAPDECVYMAATRGDRYAVRAYRCAATGTYRAEYLTRGQVRGVSTGYGAADLRERLRRYVVDSRHVDGIDLRASLDTLGVHRSPLAAG